MDIPILFLNFNINIDLDYFYLYLKDLLNYINSLFGSGKSLLFSIAFDYPVIFSLLIPIIILLAIFTKKRKLIFASRVIIIGLLIASLASPFIIIERVHVNDKPEVIIIEDQTESMAILDRTRIPALSMALQEKTVVTQRYIAGTKSAIGDAIVQNSKSDAAILLISDGNNNHGRSLDVAISTANTLGTSVYALKLNPAPSQADLSVSITGAKRVIVGSEATFDVVVRKVGNSEIKGNLTVWIDDKLKLNKIVDKTEIITITHKFATIGSHTVKAEIKPYSSDFYAENNVFYKAINTIDKPRVLLVTNAIDSPLSQVLRELYRVDVVTELRYPEIYSAVVLDNVHANKMRTSEVEALSKYVSEGGGLVVVGGEQSYDRGGYDSSPVLQALLPVYPWLSERPAEEIGILFLVDISGSTSFPYGEGIVLDYIKGYVADVLDQLPLNSSIGVIAFERYQYLIVPMDKYQNRTEIKNIISRLQPIVSPSNTYILPALKNATETLETFQGKRIAIMLTDGYPSDGGSRLVEEAVKMARKGISLYIIGVNVAPGDDLLMAELAIKGNGAFYNLEDAPPISLLFEEKKKEETKKTEFSLGVCDPNHFIAQNLKGTRFNATITGFNHATPKFGARAIIVTEDGNPIVTVWQFGLGRVAAFTTDNGNKWASQVYHGNNSKLISAVVNYAIGDPEKGIDPKITASDARLGDEVYIEVTSKGTPMLLLDNEPLILSRIGEDSYQASFHASKNGFYNLSGYLIAVNYPVEYEKLGFNSDLEEIIAAYGGKVYSDEASIREKLIEDVKVKGAKVVKEKKDVSIYFTVAALALFTTEVCIRRIMEIKRIR
ncbi:MAG: VWA domain-containing protein [Methanocellales archaeon]